MSNRRSKFAGIFDQEEPPAAEPAAPAPEPATTPPPVPTPTSTPAVVATARTPRTQARKTTAPAPRPPTPAPTEKPLAKSKDPDYAPVTLYVRRDVYTRVQIELLKQGRTREVSDVVTELLSDWLEQVQ